MAKTYYYCDGTTKKSVSINLTSGACSLYQTYDDGYNIYKTYRQKLTFTVTPAATENITVGYTYTFTMTRDGYVVTTQTGQGTATIPSGNVSYYTYVTCKEERWGSTTGDPQNPL